MHGEQYVRYNHYRKRTKEWEMKNMIKMYKGNKYKCGNKKTKKNAWKNNVHDKMLTRMRKEHDKGKEVQGSEEFHGK